MADMLTTGTPGALSLSGSAPKIRITAGLGTAQQKTWNLRRPVTLIGASRLAHIVLAADTVSRAHCLIINTGNEVLLKDLHSTNGVRRNDRSMDFGLLNDGDVVRLGDNPIQVAIQSFSPDPGETDCGSSVDDPLKLSSPWVLCGPKPNQQWTVEDTVTIIGRRPGVPIRLEHPEVALVHAALVHIDGHAAVFDLTSASGTWVDGKRVSLALLRGGERLRIGPIELRVKEQAAEGVFGEQSELEFASGAGVRIGQLLKLQEELRIRTRQIDQREEHLESEQALLEKSRSAVERDRRALQQQALALWKARTQFDVERSLHSGAGSATVGGSLSLPAPPIIEAANSSELAQDQPPRVLRVAEPGGLGWTDPRRPA